MKSLKIAFQTIYFFLIIFLSYVVTYKIFNLNSFQINIFKTGIFNNEYAKYLSYFVVSIEIMVLFLLLFYKKTGLLMFSIMIFIFTIYISILFYFNRYEVCGCGGILNGLKYKYHLLINLFLIFSSFLTLQYFKNENKH